VTRPCRSVTESVPWTGTRRRSAGDRTDRRHRRWIAGCHSRTFQEPSSMDQFSTDYGKQRTDERSGSATEPRVGRHASEQFAKCFQPTGRDPDADDGKRGLVRIARARGRFGRFLFGWPLLTGRYLGLCGPRRLLGTLAARPPRGAALRVRRSGLSFCPFLLGHFAVPSATVRLAVRRPTL
jgi:hypothetical protein